MLTQARLKELLRYNPKTGEFFWRVTMSNRTRAGMRAGHLDVDGYRRIRISGRAYHTSRLAWLYVYNTIPSKQLDHKNRKRDDNRIANLRQATNGQNLANSKVPKNSISGFKGLYWRKNGWEVHVYKNKKCMYLGRFRTLEAARAVQHKVARRLHGEFFCAG